ncbi:hypothetical protein Tco_0126786 [Tanacetum coccineum]
MFGRLTWLAKTLKDRPLFPITLSIEIYASYEPLPRIDPFEKHPCLGSNIFSEAIRKSDKVYQNLMENSLALNHKLDELIESLKSLPMEINEENLAKHEYHEQQDLVFQNKGFKSQETIKESFRQLEQGDQISEKDSYELDHEFEMAREGFKILRFKFGLDSKTHDKHIGELDKIEDEAENPSPQSTP